MMALSHFVLVAALAVMGYHQVGARPIIYCITDTDCGAIAGVCNSRNGACECPPDASLNEKTNLCIRNSGGGNSGQTAQTQPTFTANPIDGQNNGTTISADTTTVQTVTEGLNGTNDVPQGAVNETLTNGGFNETEGTNVTNPRFVRSADNETLDDGERNVTCINAEFNETCTERNETEGTNVTEPRIERGAENETLDDGERNETCINAEFNETCTERNETEGTNVTNPRFERSVDNETLDDGERNETCIGQNGTSVGQNGTIVGQNGTIVGLNETCTGRNETEETNGTDTRFERSADNETLSDGNHNTTETEDDHGDNEDTDNDDQHPENNEPKHNETSDDDDDNVTQIPGSFNVTYFDGQYNNTAGPNTNITGNIR